MKPRDRVLEALNHNEADRVPIDFGGMDSSGITGVAYNNLKKFYDLSTPTKIYDPAFQVAKIEPFFLKKFHADVIPLLFEPKKWKNDRLPDGSHCLVPEKWDPISLEDGSRGIVNHEGEIWLKQPSRSHFFDCVNYPLKDAKTIRDIEKRIDYLNDFDLPSFWDESYDELGTRAKRIFKEGDYAIIGCFLVHVYMAGQLLRGFDTFIIDLCYRKEIARFIMEYLVESYKERFDDYISAIGDYVDIIQVSDDLGTQIAPQISPMLYREMVKPYHRELFKHIKEGSKSYLFFHSDGSIIDLIPDLIEMGVDILNPIQVSSKGMDPKILKQKFGDKITLWGAGCDTQRTLPMGTPENVRKEVKRRIEELSEGGGYVFNQIHNIQPDVPPENIIAMFEAAYAYGEY